MGLLGEIKKERQSGYYWVKWSYVGGIVSPSPAWRIAAYGQNIGWKLPGDERLYYDENFLEINENRIPFRPPRVWFWLWAALAANLIAAGIYTYHLLKH